MQHHFSLPTEDVVRVINQFIEGVAHFSQFAVITVLNISVNCWKAGLKKSDTIDFLFKLSSRKYIEKMLILNGISLRFDMIV